MNEHVFHLPDVGEGLTEAEIVKWHVEVGDTVELNQVVVEIETAKAIVELPSPHAGVVAALLADARTVLAVGSPLLRIRTSEPLGSQTQGTQTQGTQAEAPPDGPPAPGSNGRVEVLVGYGPSESSGRRRARRADPTGPPADAPAAPPVAPVAPKATAPVQASSAPRATPPVRTYARRLGVDLAVVAAAAEVDGRITRAHIDAYLAAHKAGDSAATAHPTAHQTEDQAQNQVRTSDSSLAQTGAGSTVLPLTPVRRATAAAMVRSAFTAPHASLSLTVDATRMVKFIAALKQDPRYAGTAVSPTLIAARALVIVAQRYPELNSRWEEAGIRRHHAVNLGIAAATDRGLVVPTIGNAHDMSLRELAHALSDLATTARAGRTSPQAMSGGTLTLTNVGVFGVDNGSPILNPGESAILCMGALRKSPWEHRDRLRLRTTLALTLAFDHRVIDGDVGGRALRDLGQILSRPAFELAIS